MAKIRKIQIRIYVILAILFISFAVWKYLSRPEKNTSRHFVEEYSFSIELPKEWVIDPGRTEAAIASQSPHDKMQDNFLENIAVMSGPIGKIGGDAEKYFLLFVKQLEASSMEYGQNSVGDTKIDGVLARWVDYSYDAGGLKLRTLMFIFGNKANYYIITCNAEEVKFNNYKQTFHSLARSFRFE